MILGNLQQPVHLILRQLDCQNTILEGVAGEDIGKTGCDHRCQPHIQHGPGGMFAARSATEVVARDENGGVSEILDIERIPGRRADGFECACTEPFAAYGLEPVGGDDDVGIDVLEAQRNGAPLDGGNGLHP